MKTEAGEEKMDLRTQISILYRENKMNSNNLNHFSEKQKPADFACATTEMRSLQLSSVAILLFIERLLQYLYSVTEHHQRINTKLNHTEPYLNRRQAEQWEVLLILIKVQGIILP